MPPNHAPASEPDPLLGELCDGRYRIDAIIGQGGMGTIYRAEHVLLRRKVAVKTLHPGAQGSQRAIERFHREAIAAGAVGNEHVVSVTDMGKLQGGAFYVVLEYLEGADIGYVTWSEGPFSIARTLRVALQLCSALSAVHRAGIVHRDLKPENLFLTRRSDGTESLKILDFGICKFHDLTDPDSKRLTDTATLLGTPHFMAPEQIEATGSLDHRADLYAAGANIYYMLTGSALFDSSSIPGLLYRICTEPAPDIRAQRPHTPEALAQVLERATAKRPEQRFQSAEEMYGALLEIPIPTNEPERAERISVARQSTRATAHAPTVDNSVRERAANRAGVTAYLAIRRRRRLAALRVVVGTIVLIVAYAAVRWAQPFHNAAAPTTHVVAPRPASERAPLIVPDALPTLAAPPKAAEPNQALATKPTPEKTSRASHHRAAQRVESTPPLFDTTTSPAENSPPTEDSAVPRARPERKDEPSEAYVPSRRDIIHVFDAHL